MSRPHPAVKHSPGVDGVVWKIFYKLILKISITNRTPPPSPPPLLAILTLQTCSSTQLCHLHINTCQTTTVQATGIFKYSSYLLFLNYFFFFCFLNKMMLFMIQPINIYGLVHVLIIWSNALFHPVQTKFRTWSRVLTFHPDTQ